MSFGDIRDKLVQLSNPWGGFGGSYVEADLFPVRHRLVSELNAESDVTKIFEFGSYYGYCLVTMLDAAPNAEWVGSCDRDEDANEECAVNLITYLTELYDDPQRNVVVDRQQFTNVREVARWLHALAPVDVVAVDGDHSYAGCYGDLTMALAMCPRMILVDDYTAIGEVKKATDDFAAYFGLEPEVVETVNGLAVFRP